MKLFVSIILACMCLPFLGVGLYEVYESKRELDSFQHTVGRVTGNTYSQTNIDGNVSGAYHPEVEFADANGKKIRFTDGIGSLPPDYETGAEVEVIFNPEAPEKARLYSWKRFWLAPSIFIAVGLLPMIIAFILMRRLNL